MQVVVSDLGPLMQLVQSFALEQFSHGDEQGKHEDPYWYYPSMQIEATHSPF